MSKYFFKHSKTIRKLEIWYFSKREGGIYRSESLRRIYKDLRGIDAGYASYGWTSDLIDGPAVIGNYSSIGRNVRRIATNHLISCVTTHPCIFSPSFGWVEQDRREKKLITIGNDVWIGDNVTILPSVASIGDGAIIAAGAVVSKDVPRYEIWGGVPAHFIKKRFTDEIIVELEKTEWWNYPEEKLFSLKEYFDNPKKLIESLK